MLEKGYLIRLLYSPYQLKASGETLSLVVAREWESHKRKGCLPIRPLWTSGPGGQRAPHYVIYTSSIHYGHLNT